MAEIQKNILNQGQRNVFSRLFHAKVDKDTVATWRQDLVRVLHVFNVRTVGSVLHPLIISFQTELAINTHIMVMDLHRNASTGQETAGSQRPLVSVIKHLFKM